MSDSTPSIYIAGAGGHGRELRCYLEDLQRSGWRGELRGYLDDRVPVGWHGRLNVLGPIEGFEKLSGWYITATGSNTMRREIVERIETRYGEALRPWTLIHPRSYLGQDTEIGEGTCVAPCVVVTAKTKIGNHCIINVKASISHDCRINNFANINPGATVCGSVTVGEGAYIGAGAVVKECVSIGAWSIVGSGAVVVRNIPPNVTAVGVPARVVRHH